MKQKPLWLVKLFNFEYWSMWTFYTPLLPYLIFCGLKARSLAFISALNRFGGKEDFIGEDKFSMIEAVATDYKPINLLFEAPAQFETVASKLKEIGLKYPIIAKPNMGERGLGVEKICDELELKNYLDKLDLDLIIQEFIEFEIELGVFFIKKPNDLEGKVTSVTLKEFLSVLGDGKSTVDELLQTSDRGRFQLKRLRADKPDLMSSVPQNHKKILVEPIGNHRLGTKFLNANYLICNELNEVFNKISAPITGFHYGRYDVKVKSIDDMMTGKNIKVMEINGGFSEVTHVYDPSMPLMQAYTDIAQHWDEAVKICRQNSKKGIKPIGFFEVIRRLKEHSKKVG